MDSAIVAALISAPVTVVAAGAAFAAGRVQGRGAYHGPVDAVRRQHQREAYARLVSAAQTYVRQTTRPLVLQELIREDATQARQMGEQALLERVHDRCSNADASPVQDAVALITIEGPHEVAVLANNVYLGALGLKNNFVRDWLTRQEQPMSLTAWLEQDIESHQALHTDLSKFTQAASSHLNGR